MLELEAEASEASEASEAHQSTDERGDTRRVMLCQAYLDETISDTFRQSRKYRVSMQHRFLRYSGHANRCVCNNSFLGKYLLLSLQVLPPEILKQESENGNPDATHHAFHSSVAPFNQLTS